MLMLAPISTHVWIASCGKKARHSNQYQNTGECAFLVAFRMVQGMAEQGKRVGVSAAIAKGWRPVWCIVKGLGQAFRPRAEQRLANDARVSSPALGSCRQFTMDDLAGRLY